MHFRIPSPPDIVRAAVRAVSATLCILLAVPLAGAGVPGAVGFGERVVWALNVGGGETLSRAGEAFAADDCSGGDGDCAVIGSVLRTQNPSIYRSYRAGDQHYRIPVSAGSYDVVLYFAEPTESSVSGRTFDVLLEDQLVLADFSPLLETGVAGAAVTRSFARRRVDDGYVDIALRSKGGAALLSGILVRQSRFGTDGWTPLWSDEFSGDRLDRSSWTPNLWAPRRVNDEDQAYTEDPRNLRVENGLLVLEAHYEGTEEPRFSSGRVHGAGKRSLFYGRVDVRARVPVARGVWPAIWLMPEDFYRYATTCDRNNPEGSPGDACDAWPNSGEIDLMEHVGNEPGVVDNPME